MPRWEKDHGMIQCGGIDGMSEGENGPPGRDKCRDVSGAKQASAQSGNDARDWDRQAALARLSHNTRTRPSTSEGGGAGRLIPQGKLTSAGVVWWWFANPTEKHPGSFATYLLPQGK